LRFDLLSYQAFLLELEAAFAPEPHHLVVSLK
jgi:hypothetical protein